MAAALKCLEMIPGLAFDFAALTGSGQRAYPELARTAKMDAGWATHGIYLGVIDAKNST